MSHYHAVVWLDHAQAHVMHVSPDDVEKSIVHPSQPHQHLHVRSGTLGSGRRAEDEVYYHAIVEALKGAKEILVVGPASAKLRLLKHIHAHDKAMVELIVGIETVDHPTDAQVVAYARKYFITKDKMLSPL
jgi:stalled ribosome rescue protein Dom34